MLSITGLSVFEEKSIMFSVIKFARLCTKTNHLCYHVITVAGLRFPILTFTYVSNFLCQPFVQTSAPATTMCQLAITVLKKHSRLPFMILLDVVLSCYSRIPQESSFSMSHIGLTYSTHLSK